MKNSMQDNTIHDIRIAFDFRKLRRPMAPVQCGQLKMHCCKTCHFANLFPEIQGVKGEPLILNGKMHSKVLSLVSEFGFEGETIRRKR